MNNSKENTSNKKMILTFLAVLAIGLFIGVLTGKGIKSISKTDWKTAVHPMITELGRLLPWIFLGFHVICFAVASTIFAKTRVQALGWDGEDEDVIEKIEKKLTVPIHGRH